MRGIIPLMIGALVAGELVVAVASQEPTGGAAAGQAPTCAVSGCHSQMRLHKRLHEPVATNRCDTCHKPKLGGTPFQAGPRHEFQRAGDNPKLCYACHDRLGEESFVHEPVKMGVCILCHDPHGSEHAGLLSVDTDRMLCARCHRETFEQGDHVHPPVADGTCSACHNPHGSDHDKFLHAAPPELCLDCHDTIEELLDEASVTHDAVTTGRSCLSCHDPHVSGVESLLAGEAMGLCLSCHDKELDSDGGRIRNIAQYLEDNPNHHGPIRDKNCSACHNPHAGTVHRLLNKEYPAGLYAPFDEDSYALCFDCHELEMVEEEKDEEVTEFRNGDLNLHYLHVNRADKGCSCGTCHDVHAGRDSKHMAYPTKVGDQAILTSYEASTTGGSCQSGCHQVKAYDRVTPVQNE